MLETDRYSCQLWLQKLFSISCIMDLILALIDYAFYD